MGSDSHYQIPAIAFTINSREVDRGTDEWYHLCKMVREACENYGCFEIVYDKIPPQLRAETFSVSRQLFSLPLEKKKKNLNPKPYQGYLARTVQAPLYESFGLEEASNYESLRCLTEEISPNGHDQFCTVISMMKQLDELKDMINLMILDSYGLGEKSNSTLQSKTLLRIMKYLAPPSKDYTQALRAHTDKGLGTILCDDQVSGLEVETKDGRWVKLSLSPRSFVFLVADSLMAWSNGRMHSVKHRVMMRGEKERYSLGAFAVPLEGSIIKAQKELVDEEHPQILKDFDYTDFSKFFASEKGRAIDPEKQVFAYAGIST
ncbi:putative 2-oxoglutarate-dependent dioxygenase AOP1 [Rosa sericea]